MGQKVQTYEHASLNIPFRVWESLVRPQWPRSEQYCKGWSVFTFVNICAAIVCCRRHICLKLSPTNTMATASLTLNNGMKMPLLGLGTWQSKPGQVEAAVEHALRWRNTLQIWITDVSETSIVGKSKIQNSCNIFSSVKIVTSYLFSTIWCFEPQKNIILWKLMTATLHFAQNYPSDPSCWHPRIPKTTLPPPF